ncbi:MAG: hypothetical protein IK115_05735 [Lachnospiraceae bacterium]|nr:hypothetical protein [Lachnospiraceae bacterium]
MDNTFPAEEKLFRAVYPPEVVEMFWRFDGKVSSAAFADPRGLSVDREGERSFRQAAASMKERFDGRILFLRVKNCTEIGALVRYLPSPDNPYHSEIHGSESAVLLSKVQRRHLADKAVIVS